MPLVLGWQLTGNPLRSGAVNCRWVAIIYALASVVAAAGPATPDWAPRLTPDRPAALPALGATELKYSLTWKGMVAAGELTVELGKKDPSAPGQYLAKASGGSRGMAAKLFPYTFEFKSVISPRTGLPLSFTGSENDGEAKVVTAASFTRTSVRCVVTETPHGSGVAKTTTSELNYPGLRDLFATLLYVRNQRLDPGDSVVVAAHPTTRGQLVTVRVLGREKLAGKDAIKLALGLERIQGDLTLKPYKKMKSATLWLSDDALRLPLELRAAVFIGDVRMTLESCTTETPK